MELFKANRQWSTRPADERFPTIQALYDATKAYAQQAKTSEVNYNDIRVEARDGDVQLVGKTNIPAKFTHWAFGQLCARVQAPASYLRELPATLACQNLNHGLAQRVKEGTGSGVAKLMFHSNGGLLLRAITSDEYARIWNYEVADRLLHLEQDGWEPAMPDIRTRSCSRCGGAGSVYVVTTVESDNAGTSQTCPKCHGSGTEDFPALYASDHDMFAFVRNRQSVIREAGNPDGLQRGVIVENSEVGASALKLTRFLYREMCGNHIIWGASKVLEISVRHIGNARQKWGLYAAMMKQYADEGATDTENKILAAQHKVIGATKEEVLDALFGKRSLNLSRKALEASYDAVVPEQDGDPKTVWGMVQGITRYSQSVPFADKRTDLDQAAGKVMEFAF